METRFNNTSATYPQVINTNFSNIQSSLLQQDSSLPYMFRLSTAVLRKQQMFKIQ